MDGGIYFVGRGLSRTFGPPAPNPQEFPPSDVPHGAWRRGGTGTQPAPSAAVPPHAPERQRFLPPRTRRWRSGFTVSFLVLVALGCTGIREDELACENSVSLLQECCPGFSGSNIDCTYEAGCKTYTAYPVISESESACIQEKSCAELQSSGVCAKAIAFRYSYPADPTGSPSTPSQVCP
jgi:hypothetical protein